MSKLDDINKEIEDSKNLINDDMKRLQEVVDTATAQKTSTLIASYAGITNAVAKIAIDMQHNPPEDEEERTFFMEFLGDYTKAGEAIAAEIDRRVPVPQS